MIRTEYEAKLAATQVYSYSGVITIEDTGGPLVRFVIQRETACDRRWDIVSDQMIPRSIAAALVTDKPVLQREMVAQ